MIWILLSAVLAIVSNFIAIESKKGLTKDLSTTLTIVSILGLFLSTALLFEREAHKDILRGKKNMYKMEIKYELKNSTYIPCDTIFIRNK